MSRDPDPCYCQQAQDYEDLLNRVLEAVALKKPLGPLMKEIEETVGRYQQAQQEYEQEGG